MYCSNCGANLSETNKYCPECGMHLTDGTLPSESKTKPSRLDKSIRFNGMSVFVIVVTIMMLLSMILLPTFTLNYDYYERNHHLDATISILGENYLGYVDYADGSKTIQNSVNSFSRVAFIVVTVSMIMIVVFILKNRAGIVLFASVLNVLVFVIYNWFVSSFIWNQYTSNRMRYSTTPEIGYTLCLVCSVALCVLAIINLIKVRKQTVEP